MQTQFNNRLFGALLAVAFIAASCGSDSSTGTATSDCGTDNAVAVADDKATELGVAIVAPSASDDLSFTQSMIDSLHRLGIEPQVTDGTFNIDEAGAAIRSYAESGVEIIIAHGTQFGGSLVEIAPDFPTTSFIWGTATDTQGLDNVFAYFPQAQEGGYVNGWIAAGISDGGKIGVVGPVPAGDAVTYIEGFERGAKANGSTDISIVYTESFSDVAAATETAQAHVDNGAVVLSGTSQSAVGAVNVAAANDIPWFGTQSNQEQWGIDAGANDLVVASQVYHWEVILSDMFEQIDSGTLGGEAMGLTLENGGLVIELNGCYELPSDVADGAVGVIEDIIDGTIDPN
jgi:basic membrane lipoprotein Med (substrate-binding protein (PBP1-ABC) superfamily)